MGDDNEVYEFSESDLDRFMSEAKTLVVSPLFFPSYWVEPTLKRLSFFMTSVVF